MNFLRPTPPTAAPSSATDPPPSPGAHSSASATNLDPASYTLEPGPTAPIDHEAWFAEAHDTISKSVSQSLQTLQLWEQLRLRHSQLQAEAHHLVATRDHLASYARYLDDERARLDSWAKQLDRHDRRRAKAQDRFDEARRRWCVAAGLDPESTFAVVSLTDSEAEDEDAGEATTASMTHQSRGERAAGFMGSALKSAISITGATSTLSKLDKAYHVRDRVTGVPLLGSLVQSALVEESGEDREPDGDGKDDDEDDDVCLPSHVIPSSAEDSYSHRRRNGSSGSPSPSRVHRRQPLRQQSRGSSSGRRMSSAINAKDKNRADSGSSCSSASGSDSESCTSGSESDNESDTCNAHVPDINITHPSPIAASQSMQAPVPTTPTTATGLVGGLLRRAASVANLGRVTSLATSQSDGPANKSLRPASSQPHLRPASAAAAVARSVVSTSSGSSNGSSSDQTQRPPATSGGSAQGSPQTSPDVHQLRRAASMTPRPRAAGPGGRPTSMIGSAPTLAPQPAAHAHAHPVAAAAPHPVVLPAPTQMPYYAHAQYAQHHAPPPQLVHQHSMPNLSMYASPRLGVDDLGSVLSAVSTVASVAQSVGGAGAAGAVKSVGGYVLGKVLSQGS